MRDSARRAKARRSDISSRRTLRLTNLVSDFEIAPDSLIETEVKGIADELMTYGDLLHERNLVEEELQIVETKVVAGIDIETELLRLQGCGHEGLNGGLGVGGIGGSVWLGVKLDAVGTCLGGVLDHLGIGIDEDGGADAGGMESLDDVGQLVLVGLGIPSGAACESVGGIGDERHLRWARLDDEIEETGIGVALDIELGLEHLLEVGYIGVADMTLVGPWVNGDAVCAERLDVDSGFCDIWHIATAGVAYGGNFIDIDA